MKNSLFKRIEALERRLAQKEQYKPRFTEIIVALPGEKGEIIESWQWENGKWKTTKMIRELTKE